MRSLFSFTLHPFCSRFVSSPSPPFRPRVFCFRFGFGWTRVKVLMIIHRLMTRLVDGEWTDPDIPDPLTNMFDLLTDRKDRQLTQKWGIWLTRKDSERAINVRFLFLHVPSRPSIAIAFHSAPFVSFSFVLT